MSTFALGVEGSSLNPIQASESIETNVCTSSVSEAKARYGNLLAAASLDAAAGDAWMLLCADGRCDPCASACESSRAGLGPVSLPYG